MKKTIPEITTYYCDSCGGEIQGSDKASNCKIKMTSDGLDYSGKAVGPGSGGAFDCCFSCYHDILKKLTSKEGLGDNQ